MQVGASFFSQQKMRMKTCLVVLFVRLFGWLVLCFFPPFYLWSFLRVFLLLYTFLTFIPFRFLCSLLLPTNVFFVHAFPFLLFFSFFLSFGIVILLPLPLPTQSPPLPFIHSLFPFLFLSMTLVALFLGACLCFFSLSLFLYRPPFLLLVSGCIYFLKLCSFSCAFFLLAFTWAYFLNCFALVLALHASPCLLSCMLGCLSASLSLSLPGSLRACWFANLSFPLFACCVFFSSVRLSLTVCLLVWFVISSR